MHRLHQPHRKIPTRRTRRPCRQAGLVVWYTVDTLWDIKRGEEITLIGGRTMGTAQKIELLKSEVEYDRNTTATPEEWMEYIEGIEFRIPTASLLREARLLNIPKRRFCVSADIETITAESYCYLNDREEFTPPVI